MQTAESFISLSSRVIKTELVQWRKFQYIQQQDFKNWTSEAKEKLKRSIVENEFTQPFYVWHDVQSDVMYCLDGRHRTLAMEELSKEGYNPDEMLPATFIRCKDKKDAAKLVLIYSSIYARVSTAGLFDFVTAYDLNFEEMKLSIDLPEFDSLEFNSLLSEQSGVEKTIPVSLLERFIVPPFSVLDTRQGYWQERKKQWHSIGFDSQETREDVYLIAKSGQSSGIYELRNKMREQLGHDPSWDEIIAKAKKKGMHLYEGASIFDPVLAEVCYKWFCPEAANILDPFAGGSVRGIVAALLGFNYYGIDLRAEQVEANRKQWQPFSANKNWKTPTWVAGDSKDVVPEMQLSADFIFSCPPYHDLEKYSDDPADVSNMSYEDFVRSYTSIIKQSVQKLNDNRFACFVVGEIRDENGLYRNFVGATIQAFIDAGMGFYNEIILLNVAGSMPIRVGRQFQNSRKVGKTHQNVLVFYKGDQKEIKKNYPELKIEMPETEPEAVELL